MHFIPVKPPKILQVACSNYVWKIPSEGKIIYLTFDDGPTPKITDWTLDTLKQYNAKATFFCIGNNIKKYPEIFENIIQDGHTIGNHTYNHIKGWKTPLNSYKTEVETTQQLISSKQNLKLFRPPYGQITPKQGKTLIQQGYTIIMWSVLPMDWKHTISREACLKNIIKHTTSGSIIVLHDSEKAKRNLMYALPKMLDYFSNKGYTFKQIRQLNQ